MAELTWSPRAIGEFADTCEFLGKRSESYATTFAKDVRAIVVSILEQPRLGAMVPEYEQDEIRERYYQNHRIIYRIRGEEHRDRRLRERVPPPAPNPARLSLASPEPMG